MIDLRASKFLKFKVSIDWPTSVSSSDPNDFYRGWLEEHVGKQEIDWDWEIDRIDPDGVAVYFRTEKDAFTFAMFGQI